ncbi:MAG TPA: penicillin-binding protein 2 [Nocardioidaceae bacterium]|nr:penicillin-binding protein 2 [Nocardioidaceae bacterium]
MNRPIRLLSIGCILLFMALLLNINYVQFVNAEDLNNNSGNSRVQVAEFSRERGPILVADDPIAVSRPVNDRFEFQRRYPQAQTYSHLTGYYSYLYGSSGLELTQNEVLSGSDPRLFVNRVVDLVTSEEPQGGSVMLTVERAAQRAAFRGLQDLPGAAKGAVVALRPDTGEVLAMASSPGYNPNRLASHNFDKTEKAWKQLNRAPADPMFNRAIQGRFPPGSTFKLVTASAALETGNYSPDSSVTGTAALDLPLTTTNMVNESGGSCGADTITLRQALAVSCNTAFADVGMKVGAERIEEQAQKYGFGQDVFEDLPGSVESVFPEDPDAPQTAFSAIGQFDVAATPLQMAMVVAGIANDGTVMKPHLVSEVRSPDLDVLEEVQPEELSQATSTGTAEQMQSMMVSVTNEGTGGTGAIPGIEVGSKTGTAQSSDDRNPYAWYVSFAPADDPQVAVAVFVEEADVSRDEISGSGLGGPIAKSVMQAVVGR